MRELLQRVFDGEVSFDEYALRTRGDWDRLAAHLLRRYRCPAGVVADDVRQQLLLEAWLAVWRWNGASEGERAMAGVPYVMWCSYTQTKHWLNRQRNSARRSDRAPGRYPIGWDDAQGAIEDAVWDAYAVERMDAAVEVRRLVARAAGDDYVVLGSALVADGIPDSGVVSRQLGVPPRAAQRRIRMTVDRLRAASLEQACA